MTVARGWRCSRLCALARRRGGCCRRPAAAAPWTGRTYPGRYDLRTHGRVTRVGQQDHYGTCWIFAAHRARSSPACCPGPGSTSPRTTWPTSRAPACASRGAPRAPSLPPTSRAGRVPCWSATTRIPGPGRSREGLPAVRHVQEVLFLPPHGSPRANDAIKWAVMRYGAVDATMAYEHERLQRGDQRLLLARHGPRPPRLHRRLGRRLSGRAVPAPPARPRRLPHQEQLGRHATGRAATSGSPTTTARSGTTLTVFNGVEGAANHDAIYQHDALGWSRSIGYRQHDGVVRRPVHERRRRQRHRGELLHGQARRDLRGPRRAVARRDRRRAGRRLGHARRRRVPHGAPGGAGAGHDRRRFRRRRPPDHAGYAHAHPGRAPDPAAGAPRPPWGARSSAATASSGRTSGRARFRVVGRVPQGVRGLGGRGRRRAAPRVRARARFRTAGAPPASISRSPTRRSPAAAP